MRFHRVRWKEAHGCSIDALEAAQVTPPLAQTRFVLCGQHLIQKVNARIYIERAFNKIRFSVPQRGRYREL